MGGGGGTREDGLEVIERVTEAEIETAYVRDRESLTKSELDLTTFSGSYDGGCGASAFDGDSGGRDSRS